MNFTIWALRIEKGFFWGCFLVILGIYGRTFFTYYDQILPAYNDEYGYYLQVKNFYENQSLKMPFSVDGIVSEVGEFSFHGFSYGLFHGSVARLFGFYNHSIFTNNFVLTIFAFLLCFLIPTLKMHEKAFIVTLIALHFSCFSACFSYMQDTFTLVFSVSLFLVLSQLTASHSPAPPLKWLVIFLAVVILATLFRVLWVFFLPAVWFLYTRKITFRLILLSAGLVLLTVLYQQKFYASFPSWHTALLKEAYFQEGFGKAFSMFFGRFFSEVLKYLKDTVQGDSRTVIDHLIVLFFPVLCLVQAFRRPEKIWLSILLGVSSVVISVFFLYEAQGAYGFRILAFVHYFMSFAVVLSRWRVLIYLFFAANVYLFVPLRYETFHVLKHYYTPQFQTVKTYQYEAEWAKLQNLTLEEKREEIVVRLPRRFLDFMYPHAVSLPVRTHEGKRIFYTVEYLQKHKNLEKYDYRLFDQPFDSLQFETLFKVDTFRVVKKIQP